MKDFSFMSSALRVKEDARKHLSRVEGLKLHMARVYLFTSTGV